MIHHPIPPVWDKNSTVLILGSFPSVKSRETGFFYGHPRNRFWEIVASVHGEETPRTIEEKKAFLHRNHIALWDVIGSCEIKGSSDASIRNVTVNDIRGILSEANIRTVFVNGKTAFGFYRKYLLPLTGKDAACLPSTSPLNASWSVERLTDAWKCIKETDNEEQ